MSTFTLIMHVCVCVCVCVCVRVLENGVSDRNGSEDEQLFIDELLRIHDIVESGWREMYIRSESFTFTDIWLNIAMAVIDSILSTLLVRHLFGDDSPLAQFEHEIDYTL